MGEAGKYFSSVDLCVLGAEESSFGNRNGVLGSLTFVANRVIPHFHKLLGPLGSRAGLGSKSAPQHL